MSKAITAGTAAVTLALLSGAALADDMVYAGFPVTVKGYSGSKRRRSPTPGRSHATFFTIR